jgi:glucosylceramidase
MGEYDRFAGRVVVTLLFLLAMVTLTAGYWAAPHDLGVKPVPAGVQPRPPTAGVELWLSTQDRRLRLARQADLAIGAADHSPADIVIDIHQRYQTIVGFGAALTDASAWLLQNKLTGRQRSALLQELFGPPPQLNLNMTRLTIGGSDFSLQQYTLDDLPAAELDPSLQHFNVASNLRDVMPTLREVMAVNPQLRIIASPWSAPGWMKTSETLIGGELLPQYENAYAQYLVKYIDTYRSYGIPIFALTLQNEPGFVPVTYPAMELPAATRARIIAQYLGPALATRKPTTRILEWDHNWDEPQQPLSVLGEPAAARYIDGVAWHCYSGNPAAQSQVHRAFPDKDAYITECSGGDWASSANGELLLFAGDIVLAGLRNWARGVVYWNLALDEQYGPHSGGCRTCKGLVVIDSRTGAVSRNDEYYAFAHFSRFVLPGAVRIESSTTVKGIATVAFQNAHDGTVVLVVVNSKTAVQRVAVKQDQIRFQSTLPPRSVATFVWNPQQAAKPTRAIPPPFVEASTGKGASTPQGKRKGVE